MKLNRGVDVVPLDDLRTHDVPGGYQEDRDGKGWLSIERPSSQVYAGCWCMPRLEPLIGPEGTLSVVYVHRAMDNREETE